MLRSLTPGEKSSGSDSKLQPGFGGSTAGQSGTNTGGARHRSRRISTTILGTVKGDSTEELGEGNEMGIIARGESSGYVIGIHMAAAGYEAEKSIRDIELRKGGILMSITVHVSEHVADEHTKCSDEGEQIAKSALHSHDVEKGLGWAR
jgi:hypothetical protein